MTEPRQSIVERLAVIERKWTIRVCADCGHRLRDNEVHGRGFHKPDGSRVDYVEVVPARTPQEKRNQCQPYPGDPCVCGWIYL